MDFHLERELRLNTDPEYKSRYTWAINEIDSQGQRIGADQIPWHDALWFSATSCVLRASLDIKSRRLREETTPTDIKSWPPWEETTPTAREIEQGQVIRVQLRPDSDSGNYRRETTFSMFGTARSIESFQLNIHPIADPAQQERCQAWGSVSRTSEFDVRDLTTNDCIVFYLFVKPETFARYVEKIAHGLLDEISFSVDNADGFYSEWSPSIFARYVKVLTSGAEHKLTLPDGWGVAPRRLGHISRASLSINRRLEFGKSAPEPAVVEEIDDIGMEQQVPETPAPVALDSRMLQMLQSLKHATWFVACLLALILIVTLSKR